MFTETVATANYQITGKIDPIMIKLVPWTLGFFGGFILTIATLG